MRRNPGFDMRNGRRGAASRRAMMWVRLSAMLLAIAGLALLGYMLVNLGRQLLLGGAATLADVGGETTVTLEASAEPTFDAQEAYNAQESSAQLSATPTPAPDDQSEVPVDELPEDMQPLTTDEIRQYEQQNPSN